MWVEQDPGSVWERIGLVMTKRVNPRVLDSRTVWYIVSVRCYSCGNMFGACVHVDKRFSGLQMNDFYLKILKGL